MVKKLLLLTALLLLALLAVLVYNTYRFESKQLKVNRKPPIAIEGTALNRLSEAIQLKTISFEDTALFQAEPFLQLHQLLARNYPAVNAAMEKSTPSTYSLLYHWKGRNSTLKPVVLMAHMDVVPVEEETLDKWTFDPFSGKVQDGFIWGRGLLDDKGSLVAMMEAAESLITEKFVPERDIYFVFGHDEEIGGRNGAAKIASLLLAKGVKPEFVLDEGGVISKGIMPGVQQPLALVGISEKGYASVELISAMAGGHSSMPQQETPILLVSRAVSKLVENQFPAEFSPPVQSFMEYVGPEMPLARKAIFANRWLFKPMILGIYEQSNSGNALVRTTTAPTIFRSGVKDNVLPNLATATVNFRILPGTTSGEVLEHVKEVIADERITVRLARAPNEPSPVSGVETPGFKALTKTIRETFPETIVSPYLVIGATDGRYFAKITSDIYRFAPFTLTPEDLERVHGINERISIRDYHASINFYLNLIRNL